MVLGRPLKGLRQKDIDPTEREAIMTEMFKRARPFLERNIEKAKQKEVERKREDEREDEEQRKQEQIRSERLLRTEGIPVHLLSATASDFRSASKTASSYAPTGHAHGGDISDDTMSEMQAATLRALKRSGTRCPRTESGSARRTSGARRSRRARRHGDSPAHARVGPPRAREAIGFVLAVCALDRAGKIILKRHEKFPEAVDLAAMRLAENAEVPETEPSPTRGPRRRRCGVGADRARRAAGGDVACSAARCVGRLTPGGKRGDESVAYAPAGTLPRR